MNLSMLTRRNNVRVMVCLCMLATGSAFAAAQLPPDPLEPPDPGLPPDPLDPLEPDPPEPELPPEPPEPLDPDPPEPEDPESAPTNDQSVVTNGVQPVPE